LQALLRITWGAYLILKKPARILNKGHLSVLLIRRRFPLQWAFLTGKITREHQIEEHFLEYLNNLKEIPEEREYVKNLLNKTDPETKKQTTISISDLPRVH